VQGILKLKAAGLPVLANSGQLRLLQASFFEKGHLTAKVWF